MKALPFSISKPENVILVYQEDYALYFYDKYHQHDEIQLSLIVKGEGTLVVGESVSEYNAGDILVIGSNLPHVFKSDADHGGKSLMISLFVNKNSFELGEFESLQPFFKEIIHGIKIVSNKDKLNPLFLKLKKADKLERFVLLIQILQNMRISQFERLSSFVYQKSYTDNEGKRMRAVFEYTMDNFTNVISLSQIANVATMTTNAFCKYFKQRTNKTYFQFLTEVRIDYACKLLVKSTDLSIAEIALSSGFNNISNFNRKFKRMKKLTPMEFRKTPK